MVDGFHWLVLFSSSVTLDCSWLDFDAFLTGHASSAGFDMCQRRYECCPIFNKTLLNFFLSLKQESDARYCSNDWFLSQLPYKCSLAASTAHSSWLLSCHFRAMCSFRIQSQHQILLIDWYLSCPGGLPRGQTLLPWVPLIFGQWCLLFLSSARRWLSR